MTQKEELRILRDLLFKIGNGMIGAEMKGNYKEYLGKIMDEIRYGYCYNQSNSYEGQTNKDFEKLRVASLKRIDKL